MVTLSSCLIWQIISFIPPNEYGCVYAWTTLGNIATDQLIEDADFNKKLEALKYNLQILTITGTSSSRINSYIKIAWFPYWGNWSRLKKLQLTNYVWKRTALRTLSIEIMAGIGNYNKRHSFRLTKFIYRVRQTTIFLKNALKTNYWTFHPFG